MHPTLEPLVHKEFKKLLDAKIIFPTHHSSWVANTVHVHKKSGEIIIYIDFEKFESDIQKRQLSSPSRGTNLAISLWF